MAWGGTFGHADVASVKRIRGNCQVDQHLLQHLEKLKIKIDTCKIRLSREPWTTGNCNLSSGCGEYHEEPRQRAPCPVNGVCALRPLSGRGFWLVSRCCWRPLQQLIFYHSLFLCLADSNFCLAISEKGPYNNCGLEIGTRNWPMQV